MCALLGFLPCFLCGNSIFLLNFFDFCSTFWKTDDLLRGGFFERSIIGIGSLTKNRYFCGINTPIRQQIVFSCMSK